VSSADHAVGADVEIVEITRNADAMTVLKDFSIDLPSAGGTETGYLVEVAGWAVGRFAEVAAVDVRCRGLVVGTVATQVQRPDVPAVLPHLDAGPVAGFGGIVALPGVPTRFELEVVVHLSDGTAVGIGDIRGTRSRTLPPAAPAALAPLLVTSLGRTGTSWLLHLLGQHPAIVRHGQWGYELDAVGFFEERFRSAATRPHGADQPASFAPRPGRSWWGLDDPFLTPGIADWFRADHVERAAAHAREDLVAFYGAVAESQGVATPRYFAEKFHPQSAGFPLELFGAAREIILVRDFRDMICSILAINRKRGYAAFDAEHAATDADLPQVLLPGVESLVAVSQERPSSLVVRYEDLVAQPERTLAGVLTHLDLPADQSSIAAMLAAANVPHPAMGEHRTSTTQRASVGRWRTELDPKVVAACESVLGEAMQTFGYVGDPEPVAQPPATDWAERESGQPEASTHEFATSADGRLPVGLARTEVPVDETISPADEMAVADIPGYLAVGESALKAIRLALVAARAPEPQRVLDFACGHGRVMRWLRAAYPDARLTGSDIHTDGVDFCARTFGATGVYSSIAPAPELFGDRFDLIWVGSLFTHLDQPRWDDFLELLHELLAPGGVLVMTTHGELVAERMRRGAHYGYPESAVTAALDDYAETGFGFMTAADDLGVYGLSVSSAPWAVRTVLRYDDLRIVSYTEGLWANHQDVVAVVRRPVDPKAAERPYT
jgi:SAM-dependent methyltransferase